MFTLVYTGRVLHQALRPSPRMTTAAMDQRQWAEGRERGWRQPLESLNGHEINHEYLVKIEIRDVRGNTRRYQINNRETTYNYRELVSKSGPSSH